MSAPVEANNGIIRGNLGRDIKINPNWVNPTGLYRIGHKRAYELFPRDLSKRVQEKQQKLSKEIKSEVITDCYEPYNRSKDLGVLD